MSPDNHTLDPGGILLTGGDATNPHGAYAEVRERCPVGRSQIGDLSLVYISRFEDVSWALHHPEYFSSRGDAIELGEQPLIPLQLDPPKHTKYRRLVSPQFALTQIKRLEPDLRELVRNRVDSFAQRGQCDFHEEFATPLPTSFFLALVDLPLEDLPMFLRWRDESIRPAVDPGDFEAAAAVRKRVGEEISDYFRRVLAERRSHPDDSFFSRLFESAVDGEPLSDAELLGFSHLLLLAGLDTVTAALDCLFAHLAQNPESRRQLVADESLIPGAVEELLRWETPVTMVVRTVKQPLEIGGIALSAGENVSLVLGAANQDEREFGDPTVEFKRQPNRHVAFGTGNHFCLGAHLARAELRIAIEEFHRRIPDYRVSAEHQPRFSPGIRQADKLVLEWET